MKEPNSETERFTILIPVYNEGENICHLLDALQMHILAPHETLVVFDSTDDSTVPFIERAALQDPSVIPMLNTYGRGPGNAIKYGFDHATTDVVVVTMSDGSDDIANITALSRLVNDNVVVAAASRYMRGGKHIGGPVIKGLMSKVADLSLYYFGRVGTHDATNAFKAYYRPFVQALGIESTRGFELGIEFVAKARRYRKGVVEIPTVWNDRVAGESHFKVVQWLPHYLKWYFYAWGSKKQLPSDEGPLQT